MKKRILFFVYLVVSHAALSCDVCGCGAFNSTQGLGTLAQGNRTSIGLNYQYRLYKSKHPKVFGNGIEHSTDYFQRLDVLGQLRLSKRWQLQLSVPISFNTHIAEDTTSRKNGLGDPILMVNFFLFNKQDSLQTRMFRWIVGAGVKNPIGKFTHPNDVDLYLYPGTGTFDAVFQNSFFLQKRKWSLVQTSQYVLRGENKYKYIPGSLFSASLFAQYKFRTWGIYAGAQYSWSGVDYLNRKAVSSSPTQGKILTGIIGASIQWKDWVLQGNYHIPIAQQLGEGNSHQKTAFSISLNYFFN
ncbi:hypothetical protein [Fluviicola taffensis]|uniref:Transporter n=1 Tax=Fluviicola taffensis (strain DSM 16823 / NCIMB 13979 / RW262) TaxID=755732 RepID=F2IAX6_FLUTR|nr:hypothetical protein [Fluviicola taffensis]AEA45300.1 hypothetical protein Fluta_3328 [Fluviicola taffensis DSM 16823]